MDVQGSSFHLLNGCSDWGRCTDSATGQALTAEWAEQAAGLPSALPSALEYDEAKAALRLRRDLTLFRRAGRNTALQQSARRGAARDTYGNWYWIGQDPTVIEWYPVGDTGASTWWSVADLTTSCAGAQVSAPAMEQANFSTCRAAPPAPMVLQGLTITSHAYLAAGYLVGGAAGMPSESGLLVFDLQGGGPPLRLAWPASSGFVPWDLADTPDGGLLVLDRGQAMYWALDRYFRLRAEVTSVPAIFQPLSGGQTERLGASVWPVGVSLVTGSPPDQIDPVAIEPGPDGTVLILDSDAARGYSIVRLFDGGAQRWATSLADAIEVIALNDPTETPQLYWLLGHDFCYLAGPPATGPLTPPMLYIADAEGQQVVAFTLDPNSGALAVQPDFLPLRRFDGKALVRAATGAWYDFGDRWVPLDVFTQCRFAPQATFTTPVDFAGGPAGQPFDSQLPGCVWHRFLVDAQIPSGTRVEVRARAADDPDLLVQSAWLPQPVPYLRSDLPTGNAELAWYDPWVDQRLPDGTLPDGTGTWEFLFQQVTGRYLQVEVSLVAGGSSSPLLRSLRVWYPRFSYPQNYLPAVYRDDAAPLGFLERFLANFEGFYTATEERIELSSLLLDGRTVPAVDLQWLACWFGLVLDPQWEEDQQRFLIRHMDLFYRWRGTVPALIALLRVYLEDCVQELVFDGTCPGTATVRVVERFLTRDTGGAIFGDPSATAEGNTEADRVANTAHQFDVLVPTTLTAVQLAMVDRLVAANRPAHTAYTVRPSDDLFLVGTARLGIDTQVGNGAAFVPMVIGGNTALAAAYLGFPHPNELADRIVSDRDHVGQLTL